MARTVSASYPSMIVNAHGFLQRSVTVVVEQSADHIRIYISQLESTSTTTNYHISLALPLHLAAFRLGLLHFAIATNSL